ncbi:MAG: DUF1345 domain-containing protein [Alphaproteobacteria bacterium]|nr:DUF1345 domain-containing protein [Alphaproteobacteria bacterium]
MPSRTAQEEPPRNGVRQHFHQHLRFYAGALGAIVVLAVTGGEAIAIRLIAAADAFFVVYLALLARFAGKATPDSTMRHARIEDEGITLIAMLTMGSVLTSLTAIILVLTSSEGVRGWPLAATIASVPLGWMTVHASMALHYARLYYAEEEDGGSTRGLDFPCDQEPDVWDFLYFSFVLGMTAQTSDVQIEGRRMRRTSLVHSIVSFFYNTVIVALSVNAAVQLAN